jgi:hypothetical protein
MYIIYIYYKIPLICAPYTRRTSGHCLGTFKTGDIVSCPPLPPNLVSLITSPTSFSSLSSLSLNPLRKSLETAVRRVGGWCEIAASLGFSGVEMSWQFGSWNQFVRLGSCSEIGDSQRGREAVNAEVEESTALEAVTIHPVKTQQTEKT